MHDPGEAVRGAAQATRGRQHVAEEVTGRVHDARREPQERVLARPHAAQPRSDDRPGVTAEALRFAGA